MEVIIQFLRDTLDGPLYIVTVVICIILIFACIGYLAERKLKDKKEKEKYVAVEGSQENRTQIEGASVPQDASSTQQVLTQTIEDAASKEKTTPLVQEVETTKTTSATPTTDTIIITPVQEVPVTEVVQEVTTPVQTGQPSQAVPEVQITTPVQEVPITEVSQEIATPVPLTTLENTAVLPAQENEASTTVAVAVPEVVEVSPQQTVMQVSREETEKQAIPTPTVVTPPSPQGTTEPIPQVIVPSVVATQSVPAPTPAVTQQAPQVSGGVVAIPVVKVPTIENK